MLDFAQYCPVLFARVAEIKALDQLPASSKQRTFPVLLARPWPNAKSLHKTWEKISEAFPGRFALDLDRSRRGGDPTKPAVAEFNELFDPSDDFARYYDTIEEIEGAVPVLRIELGTDDEIIGQARHVEALDRGAVLHLNHDRAIESQTLIDVAIREVADLAVVLNVGWGRDILLREIWAAQAIERIVRSDTQVDIVVAGSSFPQSFSRNGERIEIEAKERTLHSNLIRRFNAVSIIYGDWGSTRPPTPPTPMMNIPRIDLPRPREWISFRQESGSGEGYPEIATRVMEDVAWPQNLQIWGTHVIAATADNLPGGIKSPATAAAARINIHMYVQSAIDQPLTFVDADEPYTD